MATTPPPSSHAQATQCPDSTPDPLLSSPDTPHPPFTPGPTHSSTSAHHPRHAPHSPSTYKSASKSADRLLSSLHRRGSASDDEDAMQVEHDDKLAGPAVTDFCLGSSTSKSPPSTLPLSRQSTLPSSSAGSARPPSLASPHRPLSIVVPRTPGMDVVVDGASGLEDEDDVEYEAEPAPLPTEQDVSRLEEKLRELNVEYGLEDEEGDDEHREMVGLREIYGLTAPLVPGFKTAAATKPRLDTLVAEIASLHRVIDVQEELNRKASQEQRAMFDVEREGWQAETKILLSRNHRQPSLSSGQPRASTTQDEEQGSLAAATAQHRKESGYEQIQVNGPDDYNKLLKQWMDLQAEHRKSIAEKTAMTYKMRTCESQIKALTQELHFLRPAAMHGRRPAQVSPKQSTSLRVSPGGRTNPLPMISPPQPQSRRQTLGDARSEHLLLAARRLRTLREKNPEIGLITAAHYGYASLQPPNPNAPVDMLAEQSEVDDEELVKDRTPKGKGRAKGKKAAGSGAMAPPKTPLGTATKGKSRKKDDSRTPGGSLGTPGRGFEDLLAAAQSLQHPHHSTSHPTSTLRDAYAEPPPNLGTPTAPESPKRRRVGGATSGGWVPGANAPVGSSDRQGEPTHHSSALDLLAFATAHDSPAPPSAARLGGLLGSSGDSDVASESGGSAGSTSRGLEPAFALRSESPSLWLDSQPVAGPSTTPRGLRLPPDTSLLSSSASPRFSQTPNALPQRIKEDLATDLANQSPPSGKGGASTVDGAAAPPRRARSPYLKWSVDEDELLARGVAKYGQKWDLVSKAVPTRSYHQCRQRWLRKLGMFDHKSAAVTAAATASQSKLAPSAVPPESPSRRKGSDIPFLGSESNSAESN